jgi:hypothetical protein
MPDQIKLYLPIGHVYELTIICHTVRDLNHNMQLQVDSCISGRVYSNSAVHSQFPNA